VDRGDWTLKQASFDSKIVPILGLPTVDRFASRDNSKCAVFNSRYWQQEAAAVDCFTQDWSRSKLNYVCAPFNILHKVLQLIVEQRA
jgi:hypothetical protein